MGRTEELAQLTSWFEQPGVRVLTGPPGVGKSRLAEEGARRIADGPGEFAGGVWHCDARSASQEADLWEELGSSLGVSRKGDLATVVAETLAGLGDALLVVDNVEQLPAAFDARWVSLAVASPRLRILLTSRRAVQGVDELRLGPLGAEDARALLEARLSDSSGLSAAAQAALIERLDGLPLALEGLAAQRLGRPRERAAPVGGGDHPAGRPRPLL